MGDHPTDVRRIGVVNDLVVEPSRTHRRKSEGHVVVRGATTQVGVGRETCRRRDGRSAWSDKRLDEDPIAFRTSVDGRNGHGTRRGACRNRPPVLGVDALDNRSGNLACVLTAGDGRIHELIDTPKTKVTV